MVAVRGRVFGDRVLQVPVFSLYNVDGEFEDPSPTAPPFPVHAFHPAADISETEVKYQREQTFFKEIAQSYARKED